MKVFKRLTIGLCAFTLLVTLAPAAKATDWDQKVVTTFSGPFEVPGQILPSGTYVFKLLNVWGSRDVVQVSNADETKVITTAFTIPRYRATPTSKPVFVMEERGVDSPQALQAWYYPGFTDGHQFIYGPKLISTSAAEMISNTVPAAPYNAPEESSSVAPAEPAAEPTMTEPAPEAASQPTEVAQSQAPETPAPAPANNELPKTASTTPLIALMGSLLLGAAIGLKKLASRVS